MSNSGTSTQTEWFVAKYMRDLRRREPENIGVVLRVGGQYFARFKGESDDHQIDGRRARFPESLDNYKGWVGYWRNVMESAGVTSGDCLRTLLMRRNNQPYYIEASGSPLHGYEDFDHDTLLARLYSELVEELPTEPTMSVKDKSEAIFRRIGLWEKVTPSISVEVSTPQGATDRIHFDYQYSNGARHLMRNVSLAHNDENTWGRVHAAAWGFLQMTQQAERLYPENNLIALVMTRSSDSDQEDQLEILDARAEVVIVNETEKAAQSLEKALMY